MRYTKWGLVIFFVSLGWFVVFFVLFGIIVSIETFTSQLGVETTSISMVRNIVGAIMIIYGLGILALPFSLVADYFESRGEEKRKVGKPEEKLLKSAREIIDEIKRRYLGEEAI